jgi:hypothetical protein
MKHGQCRICNDWTDLTYEHIPPAKAYNKYPIVMATQAHMLSPQLWFGDGDKHPKHGFGSYTLCKLCNERTGQWYGAEYVDWVRQGLIWLEKFGPDSTQCKQLQFTGRPSRFLKQVITMFLSILDDSYVRRNPELQRFVMDQRITELSPDYRLDMALTHGPFSRSSAITGHSIFDTEQDIFFSEISHRPFQFRFIVGGEDSESYAKIEHFAKYDMKRSTTVNLNTIIGNTWYKYPGDLRSLDELMRCAGHFS